MRELHLSATTAAQTSIEKARKSESLLHFQSDCPDLSSKSHEGMQHFEAVCVCVCFLEGEGQELPPFVCPTFF